MALDWERIIAVSDNGGVDAFGIERIILATGQKGDKGDKGEDGESGATNWGAIYGTMSRQADLTAALDAKANTADLGSLAGKDSVDYETEITNTPVLGALAAQDSVDYSQVTNKPDFGGLAFQDTVDYTDQVTNKPTLGNLADHDTVNYETEVTNKPTLGTMAAVNDVPSDGKVYGRKDGDWEEVLQGVPWGSITGTLSDQTDLQTALDGKLDTTVVALTWDSHTRYVQGDYVIYQGELYQFDQSQMPSGNLVPIPEFVPGIHEEGEYFWFNQYGDQGVREGAYVCLVTTPFEMNSWPPELSAFYGLCQIKPNWSSSLIPLYDPTAVYVEGDIVKDENLNFYVFKQTSSEYTWDPAIVTKYRIDQLISSGGGGGSGTTWGYITGTLSRQTDLQTALDAKADTADLGSMAEVDDAPSDSKEYVRKNGAWAEASGGGGGGSASWGSISGTLSNQTDLQTALDAKADTADLGDLADHDTVDYTTEVTNKPTLGSLAAKNSVDWDTDITDIPSAFPPESHNHDDRYYTETETDTLLSGKSNTGHTHDDRYYTETEIDAAFGKEILYYTSQTVSTGTSVQIMRIPASGTDSKITTDTIVVKVDFATPGNVTSDVSWTSYAGYVAFSGTCTAATTANVILAKKGN